MVQHILDEGKCRGCGKCVDVCSLELWELEDTPDGKKIAVIDEEAVRYVTPVWPVEMPARKTQ